MDEPLTEYFDVYVPLQPNKTVARVSSLQEAVAIAATYHGRGQTAYVLHCRMVFKSTEPSPPFGAIEG